MPKSLGSGSRSSEQREAVELTKDFYPSVVNSVEVTCPPDQPSPPPPTSSHSPKPSSSPSPSSPQSSPVKTPPPCPGNRSSSGEGTLTPSQQEAVDLFFSE